MVFGPDMILPGDLAKTFMLMTLTDAWANQTYHDLSINVLYLNGSIKHQSDQCSNAWNWFLCLNTNEAYLSMHSWHPTIYWFIPLHIHPTALAFAYQVSPIHCPKATIYSHTDNAKSWSRWEIPEILDVPLEFHRFVMPLTVIRLSGCCGFFYLCKVNRHEAALAKHSIQISCLRRKKKYRKEKKKTSCDSTLSNM